MAGIVKLVHLNAVGRQGISKGLAAVIPGDGIGSEAGGFPSCCRICSVLVQNQPIPAEAGNAHTMIPALIRRKVENKEHTVSATGGCADKAVDTANSILAADPLKTVPAAVISIKRRGLGIEMKQIPIKVVDRLVMRLLQ